MILNSFALRRWWNHCLPMVVLLLLVGCTDDLPDDPKSDPAEVLKAIAIQIDSQFFNQTEVIRSQLNGQQQELTPFNPTSSHSELVLAELVNFSSHRLMWSGILNDQGQVVNIYPDSLNDRMLGEDRSGLEVVQFTLAGENIDSGPVGFLQDGKPYVEYYRSIIEMNSVVGVLFCGVALDTLFERSISFSTVNDSTENYLFVVDNFGMIVYDQNRDLLGVNLAELGGSADFERLAEDLAAEREGSGIYDLTEGPGTGEGEGDYHVGWKRRTYIEDHYFVFVVTHATE